ncbi:MAG TPA: glycosyltransferase [Solirubrobacteraceae bacterium]|jgi:glycosyltransferase involved in cell wall biosynthesis
MPSPTSQRRRALQVYVPVDGGVPEHVLRVAEGLAGRGWEIDIAAPAESPAAQRLQAAGMPVHAFESSRWPQPHDVRTGRLLRRLDRERRYDVVHAHSSKAGALVRATLPRPRRLLYTPHCFSFAASFGTLTGPQRQVYRAIEQALVPRTGTLIAASDWERREGARRLRGVAPITQVLNYGVPDCGSPEPDPEVLAFKGDGRLAGSVCRLDLQKDPLTLVRAAAVLKRRGRLDFKVAVIGNGSLDDQVEAEIARLGLGEQVRRFPFAGNSQRYLAALDVFVLPSLWESLPIAVLEAMACATAVIATRVCGTPEAVVDGVSGRLAEPGDPEGLATVMDDVLHDPEQIDRLARGGHEAYERRFTLARMTDAMAELYERTAVAGAPD